MAAYLPTTSSINQKGGRRMPRRKIRYKSFFGRKDLVIKAFVALICLSVIVAVTLYIAIWVLYSITSVTENTIIAFAIGAVWATVVGVIISEVSSALIL